MLGKELRLLFYASPHSAFSHPLVCLRLREYFFMAKVSSGSGIRGEHKLSTEEAGENLPEELKP